MAVKRSTLERVQEAECTHHWVIEPQRGPISKGVCRHCGAKKEFKNYLENYERWDRSGFDLKELGELRVLPGDEE